MSSVNLDLLIAEVDRMAESTDEVHRVGKAAELSGELEAMGNDLVEHFVELARNASRSWGEIGEALGVTRQAAAQRFVAPAKEATLQISPEVQTAFAATKEAAVDLRHNYIGTEHLLIGLLADENSATKWIRANGSEPAEVVRKTRSRLSRGGSQAASRIPWTPYARRVADMAEQRAVRAKRKAVSAEDYLCSLLELGRGTAAEVLAEATRSDARGHSPTAHARGRTKR